MGLDGPSGLEYHSSRVSFVCLSVRLRLAGFEPKTATLETGLMSYGSAPLWSVVG